MIRISTVQKDENGKDKPDQLHLHDERIRERVGSPRR